MQLKVFFKADGNENPRRKEEFLGRLLHLEIVIFLRDSAILLLLLFFGLQALLAWGAQQRAI